MINCHMIQCERRYTKIGISGKTIRNDLVSAKC